MYPVLNYYVRELHIDLLLLEEFYSSDSFARWFLEKTIGYDYEGTKVCQTDHSVFELERESDLEITFQAGDGEVLFLIENKIDANFQKGQAEAYMNRAKEYVRRGKCRQCHTVLFAPEAYIEQCKSSHIFDYYISFEELSLFFQENFHLKRRAAYKMNVLLKAIEKQKFKKTAGGNYVPAEVNQGITGFWRNYWQDVSERYPELWMPEPGSKGPAATFIGLAKKSLPKGVFIYHKFVHGAVDLQLESLNEHAVACINLLQPYIEPDMSIQRAGKAAVVVRLPIASINPHQFYDVVRPVVFEAQDQAKRLLDWFNQHRKIWDEFSKTRSY